MTSQTDDLVAHTPGPWKLEETVGSFTHGVRACGKNVSGFVAFINTRWVHPEQCREQEANARLIAAAPDMLAMLKRIPGADWTSDDVRAVIAKAEGRS